MQQLNGIIAYAADENASLMQFEREILPPHLRAEWNLYHVEVYRTDPTMMQFQAAIKNETLAGNSEAVVALMNASMMASDMMDADPGRYVGGWVVRAKRADAQHLKPSDFYIPHNGPQRLCGFVSKYP